MSVSVTVSVSVWVSVRFWLRFRFRCRSQVKKRLAFQKAHEDWTQATWKSEVQVVGDMKDFTYYPEDLRAKFHQLRSPWTYMTDAERKQPAFQRPKR